MVGWRWRNRSISARTSGFGQEEASVRRVLSLLEVRGGEARDRPEKNGGWTGGVMRGCSAVEIAG